MGVVLWFIGIAGLLFAAWMLLPCGCDAKPHIKGRVLHTRLAAVDAYGEGRGASVCEECNTKRVAADTNPHDMVDVYECGRCKAVWRQDRPENATEYAERTEALDAPPPESRR